MEYTEDFGKLALKVRGSLDFGKVGIIIKSYINPANHHIIEVLCEGKQVNWPGQYVDYIENEDKI